MKKVIIILAVLLAGFLGYEYFSQTTSGDTEGGITVQVIDESGEIVSERNFVFEEEQSLFELMNENYDLGCADSSYKLDEECEFIQLNSHMILKIDTVETDWYGSYLQILVNDVPSVYGADGVMLEDNTTYTFKYVDLGGGTE